MEIFHAVILGIVQGLTEFLPVSSTGHLVLFRLIFGVSEPTLLFDTMLHVGTLAAVFAVLWKDILALLKRPVQPLTLYLIIGTVPAVLAALLFREQLETAFDTGNYLGFAFLGTSVLLVTAELLVRRAAAKEGQRKPGDMRWPDALVIGLMQAVAVIPGISRSGATLSGALSRRLDRDFAARYVFMLSIPIILGAAVFQFAELLAGGASASTVIEAGAVGIGVPAIIIGTLVSAVVGFFAVKGMLKIVREKSLWGFAVYTGILGTLVIIDRFITGLVF